MSLVHRAEYHIATFDVDRHERMTPLALARYLQETSHQHSDMLGASSGQLLQGQFWVMSGLRVQMFRAPHWRDDIIIETYPSAFETIFTRRDFGIYDAHEELIGIAAQRWMILSTERRRPMRIPETIRALVPAFPKPPTALTFEHTPAYHDTVCASNTQTVRHSDIDMNQHANHTKYIEWALDALPDSIHANCTLDMLTVDFRLECVLHDRIDVHVHEQMHSSPTQPCFAHVLTTGEKTAAHVTSQWRIAPTPL